MTIVQTPESLLQEVNGLLDSDNMKKDGLDASKVIKPGSITGAEIKNYSAVISTLPTSPVDGDICFFQSTAMATDGIVWQLRYRLGGGTYKWEFIGGPPLIAQVVTDQATASSTYVALTTAGPAVALPLTGDYDVAHGFTAYGTGGTMGDAWMSYDIGGTAAVNADAFTSYRMDGTQGGGGSRTQRKAGLTAVTLTAKYHSSNSGTTQFSNRWMKVTPVRVG